MTPNREELLSLREVGPVMDQMDVLVPTMLAVVAEEVYFWKRQLPIHMEDGLAFEGMVVRTWVRIRFIIAHVHSERKLEGTFGEKSAVLFSRFLLGDCVRRWSISASRLPVFD